MYLNWNKNGNGLLPAIIQNDRTGQILMVGYMNQEALDKTKKTKFVTFYSRSNERLWQKGEESGNTLGLISISTDCDHDALLIRAVPDGPTCHTGSISCFGDASMFPLQFLATLEGAIKNRSKNGDAKTSYTKQLLEGGIIACGAKVMEEAEEVIRAAKEEGKQRTIEEAADVLYHLLVLLRCSTIDLSDVIDELQQRSQ